MTFENCHIWLQEIERYACRDVSIILAGNKCDLAKKLVNYEEAKVINKFTNYIYKQLKQMEKNFFNRKWLINLI